jgi:hypothetical protein
MIEEVYGKATMKKMQVRKRNQCFHDGHASVNENSF